MSGVSFKESGTLLDRLLFQDERTTTRQVVTALDILRDVKVSKAVELAGDTMHPLAQFLNERRVFERGCLFIFRDELLELRLPYRRHKVAGKDVVQLFRQYFFADVWLRTATFLLGTAIVGVAFLYFGRNTHVALATAQKAAQSFWFVVGFHRVAAFNNHLLHFVEKTLFDKGRVSSFVYLAAVGEKADIECVGQNKFHAVFVKRQAAATSHAILKKKRRNIFEPRITF